jgi:hypothetical protein
MQINANDTLNLFLHHSTNGSSNSFSIWIYIICIFLIFLLIIFNFKKAKRIFQNIRPSEYEVNIQGFKIKGKLSYTSVEQEVAWKIYIELITRISGNKLEENTGILREALNSLYSAFGALREVLKNSGAELAKIPKGNKTLTVANLLLIIMNQHLRMFLAKWHPLLLEYEKKREDKESQFEHEQKWEFNSKFRLELSNLQDGLLEYIHTLKEIVEGKAQSILKYDVKTN